MYTHIISSRSSNMHPYESKMKGTTEDRDDPLTEQLLFGDRPSSSHLKMLLIVPCELNGNIWWRIKQQTVDLACYYKENGKKIWDMYKVLFGDICSSFCVVSVALPSTGNLTKVSPSCSLFLPSLCLWLSFSSFSPQDCSWYVFLIFVLVLYCNSRKPFLYFWTFMFLVFVVWLL